MSVYQLSWPTVHLILLSIHSSTSCALLLVSTSEVSSRSVPRKQRAQDSHLSRQRKPSRSVQVALFPPIRAASRLLYALLKNFIPSEEHIACYMQPIDHDGPRSRDFIRRLECVSEETKTIIRIDTNTRSDQPGIEHKKAPEFRTCVCWTTSPFSSTVWRSLPISHLPISSVLNSLTLTKSR